MGLFAFQRIFSRLNKGKRTFLCFRCSKICKYRNKFVSLQRQDECLGYPGKFPERASRIRHYPIFKQAASFGCGFAIFEKIRKKQSLAERERHGVGEDVGLRKKNKPCKRGKSSLQTGRKILGNREKGTIWLVFTTRPHKLGRAPLHLGAPARLCWSGRQNPIFIPWLCLSLGSTASGGSRAPSTDVDAHPGRGCRDKPWRSRASGRCRS